MHWPNIPYWEIRFSEGDYAKHANGSCKGIIGQPTRKGGMVTTGRARCLRCKRLVGRKAWRQVGRQLEKKVLGWDTYVNFDDTDPNGRNVYQVLVVENPKQEQPCIPTPCPPSTRRVTIRIAVPDGEPMEIQVSPAIAKRIRNIGEEMLDEFGMEALESWVDQVEAEETAEVQQEIGHPWPQPGHPLHNSTACRRCAADDEEVADAVDVEVPETGFSYSKLTAMTATPNKKKPRVKKVRRAKSTYFTINKGLLSYSIPRKDLTARATIQLREAVDMLPNGILDPGPAIEQMIDLARTQSIKERAVLERAISASRKRHSDLEL